MMLQNTLEDLHNLMLGANSDEFSTVADNSLIGRAAQFELTNWEAFIGGSYDDAQVRVQTTYDPPLSYLV